RSVQTPLHTHPVGSCCSPSTAAPRLPHEPFSHLRICWHYYTMQGVRRRTTYPQTTTSHNPEARESILRASKPLGSMIILETPTEAVRSQNRGLREQVCIRPVTPYSRH